jgi:UDP-N-acetylglucosamine transferase subunit ALG13
VIFATVGSHPSFRFERLLRALESIGDEELTVQYGPGEPPVNAARASRWMSFADVIKQMELASHVVSHAGVGTILCAVRAGHVPVVLPRLRSFGETVDDHQLELGQALARTDHVVLLEDAADLAAAVARAPSRQPGAAPGGERLIAAVRRELRAGAGTPRRSAPRSAPR